MKFLHKDCGGIVTTDTKVCSKCDKNFGVKFYLTTELILYKDRQDVEDRIASKIARAQNRGTTSYATWADSIPMVGWIASHAPKWPRRYRILVGSLWIGGWLYFGYWLTVTFRTFLTENFVYILIVGALPFILSLVARIIRRIKIRRR